MKKYQINDLVVITIPNKDNIKLTTKIICEDIYGFVKGEGCYKEIFKEIFTGEKV